jgi:NAD(P)-dependent dehydrogenase (short-subunit alcohol dehydrogenase family)
VTTDHQASVVDQLEGYRRAFSLAGRTALVLGAASGIGKASAEASRRWAPMSSVPTSTVKESKRRHVRLAGIPKALVVDARRSDEITALADRIKRDLGSLHIAVTTPATHVRKLMCDYTDEEYDRVADLNLRGTFFFLRAFARLMVAQGGGSLIASSSVRATTLEPGLAIYGATKAGIIQMVRGLASEVGQFGVRVNAIVPSIVVTPLVAPLKARPQIFSALAAHTVFDRWSEPREVATAVTFLASDAASL